MGWTTPELQFDSQQVKKLLSSPNCPDKLWGPPNLIFKGYQRLSLSPGVKKPQHELTTHLPPAPTLRMSAAMLHSPNAFMACTRTLPLPYQQLYMVTVRRFSKW
jgi:hypothetical protein